MCYGGSPALSMRYSQNLLTSAPCPPCLDAAYRPRACLRFAFSHRFCAPPTPWVLVCLKTACSSMCQARRHPGCPTTPASTDGHPGTAYVLDDERRKAAEHLTIDPNLKYDTSGKTPIILVPQPSDDPNDPLVCAPDSARRRSPNKLPRTGQYGAAISFSSSSLLMLPLPPPSPLSWPQTPSRSRSSFIAGSPKSPS